jgi:precorrin-2/cobalt-factor-2 C20-methyltransferase
MAAAAGRHSALGNQTGVKMSAGVRGRFYGIGVGPGDFELLTLKGLRLLRAAAVVAYPAPESGESFARAVVARWLDQGQREIAIRFPMVPGPPAVQVYEAAARVIAAELDAGHDVALLCQGDPLFYGTFVGILRRLADRATVEIVPGVPSLTACAAAAAWPLVTGDETLTVIPATLAEAELMERLASAEISAIVKLGRHLPKVKGILDRLDLLGSAIYVEHASLPDQRICNLAEVNDAPYFSMALVGRG